MKRLAAGQARFVVKKIDSAWRVYDYAAGSFPYRTQELGVVVQDVSEKEAQDECDRLNDEFMVSAPAPKKKPQMRDEDAIQRALDADPDDEPYEPPSLKRSKARSKVAPPEAEVDLFTPAEEVTEDDIADYGVMTPEERAKYEEGLLEKVTY